MTRLSRLVGIILHLQGRRLVRAEDLAEHFTVSVRTIYRDLRALEEAGLPLYAEAGKGYSLVDGYNLPPVMFTEEEANGLLVGGVLAERLTDNSLRPHIQSALMKINAVLPSEQKEHTERLQKGTAVHLRRAFRTEKDRANLTTLQQAVAKRRVVRIQYRGKAQSQATERDVEPLGIVYYSDNWHMLGWCRMRDGIRDFRADRIEAIEKLNEEFPERKDFSLEEHMAEFFTSSGGIAVRVLFSRGAMEHVVEEKYYGRIDRVERKDGVEMTFSVPSLDWIARWLICFAGGAVVLEPQELRDIMKKLSQEVLEQYS